MACSAGRQRAPDGLPKIGELVIEHGLRIPGNLDLEIRPDLVGLAVDLVLDCPENGLLIGCRLVIVLADLTGDGEAKRLRNLILHPPLNQRLDGRQDVLYARDLVIQPDVLQLLRLEVLFDRRVGVVQPALDVGEVRFQLLLQEVDRHQILGVQLRDCGGHLLYS